MKIPQPNGIHWTTYNRPGTHLHSLDRGQILIWCSVNNVGATFHTGPGMWNIIGPVSLADFLESKRGNHGGAVALPTGKTLLDWIEAVTPQDGKANE